MAAKVCAVCGGKDNGPRVPVKAVAPELAAQMEALHPGWRAGGVVCRSHLAEARRAHIDRLLSRDRDEITALDAKVAESIARDQSLVAALAADGGDKAPFGARVADRVAAFGGSWTFILGFTGVLVLWVAVNAILASGAFDPFPFILLNLVLSCIAALQAPLIMMSQRRQEEKDRDRAQNDYLVNLKAEIEIRLLHEKLDHLLLQQVQHMGELQAILLDEADGRRGA